MPPQPATPKACKKKQNKIASHTNNNDNQATQDDARETMPHTTNSKRHQTYLLQKISSVLLVHSDTLAPSSTIVFATKKTSLQEIHQPPCRWERLRKYGKTPTSIFTTNICSLELFQ
jgi:hypothetical protein